MSPINHGGRDTLIGLRHDVDYHYLPRLTIGRAAEMEEEVGARSTFFVRVEVLRRSPEARRLLTRLERQGWEVGLHLDNTVDAEAARGELEELRRYGFRVRGATPHGGLRGFQGEATWRVLDSLGLEYVQGYGEPPHGLRSKVLAQHLTLDWYVRRHGQRKGYELFKRDLDRRLEDAGQAVVLVHPEYLFFSVGFTGTMRARGGGARVVLAKLFSRAGMLVGTVLRLRVVGPVYRRFLEEYAERGAVLVPLRELLRIS